jgi:hypothetical protein
LGTRPATSSRKKPNTAKNAQLLKAGRMDNRRPKRVPRNKKENIYLGTWSKELETEGAREEAMERNN